MAKIIYEEVWVPRFKKTFCRHTVQNGTLSSENSTLVTRPIIWDGVLDKGYGVPDRGWGVREGSGCQRGDGVLDGDSVPDRRWGTR